MGRRLKKQLIQELTSLVIIVQVHLSVHTRGIAAVDAHVDFLPKKQQCSLLMTSGECTAFISRKQVLRKLQIGLPIFRRLCIFKGIYPVEPPHRKKVGKGSTEPRVYFHMKDILFLAHEPLINIFRNQRVYAKKLKRARALKDKDKEHRLRANRPKYDLVGLVRERYPTPEDALNELSHRLDLMFMFARLPKLTQFNAGLIGLSRRLGVEFLNYVIVSQALRKAFIGSKGFYLEAEIKGARVVWIMPHYTVGHVPTEVDLRILATCVEFDVTMVGSVLRRLYTEASIDYPPKLSRNIEEDTEDYCTPGEVPYEYLSCLTIPLKRRQQDDTDEDAEASRAACEAMDTDAVSGSRSKETELRQLQTLFNKKRFFLNREVPREVVCLLVRSCGGEASWDRVTGSGSTYQEEDEGIDYQVVDRPLPADKTKLSRYYVQPQWVFDCVNARRLLPVQDYFPGAVLPAHLSPFSLEAGTDGVNIGGMYQPPEAEYLRGLISLEQIRTRGDEGDSEEEEESVEKIEEKEESEEEVKKKKRGQAKQGGSHRRAPSPSTRVLPGQADKPEETARRAEVARNSERKLREMLLPKRHKNVYKKMVHSIKRKEKEVTKLTEKRKQIDRENVRNEKKKVKSLKNL